MAFIFIFIFLFLVSGVELKAVAVAFLETWRHVAGGCVLVLSVTLRIWCLSRSTTTALVGQMANDPASVEEERLMGLHGLF